MLRPVVLHWQITTTLQLEPGPAPARGRCRTAAPPQETAAYHWQPLPRAQPAPPGRLWSNLKREAQAVTVALAGIMVGG
eukprot:175904-Rhodomonas_salina.7